MKEIISLLKEKNKTISTMESCTGGGIANAITNLEGASEILKFSAVTYSNEFKIKLGVNEETIKKYTVYSKEVANEMSKNISIFTNSDYGIGITGQINRKDPANITNEFNKIYVSIYSKDDNTFYNKTLRAIDETREKNKKYIVENVKNMLKDILTK